MDVQSLAFVKLAERHLIKFNPDQEDEYYNAINEVPWCIRAMRQILAGAGSWIQYARGSKRRSARHAIAQRKAKAK